MRSYVLPLTIVCAVAALAACTTDDPDGGSEQAFEPKPVIVDYSPTVSDIGGLLLLLSDPAVQVVAITLPSTGEAGCGTGVDVTLGILALLERAEIPVACGDQVTENVNRWDPGFIVAPNVLLAGLPEHGFEADGRPAHQLINDTITQADTAVTIYAVGPLTNLRQALDAEPLTLQLAERIVVMGGAIDAHGNVPGSDAEWNFWIDPGSAAAVLESSSSIVLVPLDATDQVPVSPLEPELLVAAEQTPAVRYLSRLVEASSQATRIGYFHWDELAAEAVANSENTEIATVSVEVLADGSLRATPAGTSISVVREVHDAHEFTTRFLSVLAGQHIPPLESSTYSQTIRPPTPTASSSPSDVLAHWLLNAFDGDPDEAGRATTADTDWSGLGSSPDAFVIGSAPFESDDVQLTCQSLADVATCRARWHDLWLDQDANIDLGHLEIKVTVVDGIIEVFDFIGYDERIVAAFEAHIRWLETNETSRYQSSCVPDPGSGPCSSLLVETAQKWNGTRD